MHINAFAVLRGALLAVLCSLLSSSALLAALPDLPPRLHLPGDLVSGPAAGDQKEPAIAGGGPGYLTVWTDSRASLSGGETSEDIFAARLDASGNVLDTAPIIVTRAYGYQRRPQVCWNGVNWLVVWESQLVNGSFYSNGIQCVRISPAGVVLDSAPIDLYLDVPSGMLSLAANGSTWLVVSQLSSGGVVGRRIAGNGTLLDAGPVTLVPFTYFLYFNLRASSASGEYLIAYTSANGPFARRFGASLQPMGDAFAVLSTLIASNGSEYMVEFYNADGILSVSRMTAGGTVLNPAGAGITSRAAFEMDLGWDGTRWWVSWRDGFDGVSVARVNAAGTVLDPGGRVLTGGFTDMVTEHRLAGGLTGGAQVVWADFRMPGNFSYDVRGRHVAADIAVGSDQPLALGAPAQIYADVAATTNGFLIGFRSDLSGQQRLVLQRLDLTGAATDPEPIEVTRGTALSGPALAWNGTLWLVAWADSGRIYIRRYAPDLTPIDASRRFVTNGGGPDVAALGSDFLVSYSNAPSNPQYVGIFAVRIEGPTGNPLDVTPLSLSSSYAYGSRVKSFGGRWLVAWQRSSSLNDSQYYVEYCFVPSAGGATATVMTFMNGGSVDVAVADTVALVVYRAYSLAHADNDIYARRIRPDGSYIDPGAVLISNATGRQLQPAVVWDGTQFVMLWEDQRNRETFFDERGDLFGARLGKTGAVLDPAGFAVSTDAVPEMRAAIAQSGVHTLFAESVFRSESPFTSYRIAVWDPIADVLAVGDGGLRDRLALRTWPNPVRAGEAATLHVSAPSAGPVRIAVFDATGRHVRSLEGTTDASGNADIRWNARDDDGRDLSPGAFWMRVETPGGRHTVRVLVR